MQSGLLGAEYADAVPWLVAAGVAFAAWFVLFTIVARATMPRLPDPGPETMELGPEPPAVANFMAHRCELTSSAVAATLVDLAARRHVTLDQIGDGANLVRLRSTGRRDSMNAFETQVLDLVRSRVRNDTVPATELSLGYGEDADRWWKKFRRTVTEHARDLGLVRRRFTFAQIVLLSVTLAAPFALAGIAFEFYGVVEREAGKDVDAGGGLILAGFLWLIALLIGAHILRGWRETAAGKAAAAHWLGVREFLGRDESFRETPPAGVAIWDRLLAYGVALGVSHGTDAALPIGPTRDDEGWSPYRGLWRPVRIEYPKRFGYGQSPLSTAIISALVLVAAAVAAVVVVLNLVPILTDAIDEVRDDENGPGRWVFVGVAAVFSIPLLFVAVHVVRRVVMLTRAVSDLGQTETFAGYVVRVPWHYEKVGDDRQWVPMGYTAVDDGRDDEIRALRYYRAEVREGQVVRVTMTPRMRHVVHMETVTDDEAGQNR